MQTKSFNHDTGCRTTDGLLQKPGLKCSASGTTAYTCHMQSCALQHDLGRCSGVHMETTTAPRCRRLLPHGHEQHVAWTHRSPDHLHSEQTQQTTAVEMRFKKRRFLGFYTKPKTQKSPNLRVFLTTLNNLKNPDELLVCNFVSTFSNTSKSFCVVVSVLPPRTIVVAYASANGP